jgi:uncharacterized protein YjbJ (UPF0337 family)
MASDRLCGTLRLEDALARVTLYGASGGSASPALSRPETGLAPEGIRFGTDVMGRGQSDTQELAATPSPCRCSGTDWRRPPFIGSMKEVTMDWNRVEGNWKQLKGAVKQQWGKLTDDDVAQINGSREKLEGIIQERYGIAKDEARKQIDSWYRSQGLE